MNRRKAELALLFNAVIWGSTFVLVKNALREISPVLFLAIRFSLATVALACCSAFRGYGPRRAARRGNRQDAWPPEP